MKFHHDDLLKHLETFYILLFIYNRCRLTAIFRRVGIFSFLCASCSNFFNQRLILTFCILKITGIQVYGTTPFSDRHDVFEEIDI